MTPKISTESKIKPLFLIKDIVRAVENLDMQQVLYFARSKKMREIIIESEDVQSLQSLVKERFLLDREVAAATKERVLPISIINGEPHIIFNDLDSDSYFQNLYQNSDFNQILRDFNDFLQPDFFILASNIYKSWDNERDLIQFIEFELAEQQDSLVEIVGDMVKFDENDLNDLLEADNLVQTQPFFYAILIMLVRLAGLRGLKSSTIPAQQFFSRTFSLDTKGKIVAVKNRLLIEKIITRRNIRDISRKINESMAYYRQTRVQNVFYLDLPGNFELVDHELQRITESYANDVIVNEYYIDQDGQTFSQDQLWNYELEGYSLSDLTEDENGLTYQLAHGRRNYQGLYHLTYQLQFYGLAADSAIAPINLPVEIFKESVQDAVTGVDIPMSVHYLTHMEALSVDERGRLFINPEILPNITGYNLNMEDLQGLMIQIRNGEPQNQIIRIQYQPKEVELEIRYLDADDDDCLVYSETVRGFQGEPVREKLQLSDNYDFLIEPEELDEVFDFSNLQALTVKLKHHHHHSQEECELSVYFVGLPDEIPSLKKSVLVEIDTDLVTGKMTKHAEEELFVVEFPEIPHFKLKNPLENKLVYDLLENNFESRHFTVAYEAIHYPITVHFFDSESGHELEETLLLHGSYYTLVGQQLKAPVNYELEEKELTEQLRFTDQPQTITVKLHHLRICNKTRIFYKVVYENENGEELGSHRQEVTYLMESDRVTGTTRYRSQDKIEQVASLDFDGYELVDESQRQIKFNYEIVPQSQEIHVKYRKSPTRSVSESDKPLSNYGDNSIYLIPREEWKI